MSSTATRPTPHKSAKDFEDVLLRHITDLACPTDFTKLVKGKYDFSRAKAALIPSTPGAHALDDAEQFGATRLAKLVRKEQKRLFGTSDEVPELSLEAATASVGGMGLKWLQQMLEVLLNEEVDQVTPDKVRTGAFSWLRF